MTVPVQRATSWRVSAQTGRASARVPMIANTNSGIHDQGLPAHQTATSTAAAQTIGTSMVTTVRARARANPITTAVAHDFMVTSFYSSA
jgi:hypothetical protein